MASLSHLGQNPCNRDGFYTLLYILFPYFFILCSRCIIISVLNTTTLHTPKYTTAEQQQMDGNINLELSRPLCLGCAPPSLHRDSFCVQQPPLLAQISLKLAGLMNYSPGIKGDVMWSPHWVFSAMNWWILTPAPPKSRFGSSHEPAPAVTSGKFWFLGYYIKIEAGHFVYLGNLMALRSVRELSTNQSFSTRINLRRILLRFSTW